MNSVTPWQILLCLPVCFSTDQNSDNSKLKFHKKLTDLCSVFYPTIISVNELYDPIISSISTPNTTPNLSLIDDLRKTQEIPPEVASVLHALSSDAKRDSFVSRNNFASESDVVSPGKFHSFLFIFYLF